jgi:hypothetical protein
MALWGNNDNKGSGGTVSLNYSTLVVTGSGTTFGRVGAAATGDVIRFGPRGEIGNAVIVGIASTTQLSIASTAGLSGVAVAATDFQISEQPKYTVLDSRWSEINTNYEPHVYGVAAAGAASAQGTKYQLTHAGWVGVTTYNDNTGALRVKTETLVAMSGITTGNLPIYDGDPTVA